MNYQELLSELNEEMGLFWAFGGEQFKQGLKEIIEKGKIKSGEKLTSIGMGGYLPKKNFEEWEKRYTKLVKEKKEADKKENGKDKIIMRELANYEVGYTGLYDNDGFWEIMKDYKFEEEDVKRVYKKYMERYEG